MLQLRFLLEQMSLHRESPSSVFVKNILNPLDIRIRIKNPEGRASIKYVHSEGATNQTRTPDIKNPIFLLQKTYSGVGVGSKRVNFERTYIAGGTKV